jgi:hypothetical protein
MYKVLYCDSGMPEKRFEKHCILGYVPPSWQEKMVVWKHPSK